MALLTYGFVLIICKWLCIYIHKYKISIKSLARLYLNEMLKSTMRFNVFVDKAYLLMAYIIFFSKVCYQNEFVKGEISECLKILSYWKANEIIKR